MNRFQRLLVTVGAASLVASIGFSVYHHIRFFEVMSGLLALGGPQ